MKTVNENHYPGYTFWISIWISKSSSITLRKLVRIDRMQQCCLVISYIKYVSTKSTVNKTISYLHCMSVFRSLNVSPPFTYAEDLLCCSAIVEN